MTTTTTENATAPSSNHAVIVSSSRYWFNYRHAVNALSIYQMCRDNGIPDENIVLMLADDLPSNTRNPVKNGMFSAGAKSGITLYDGASIEVDYRGEDVTVDNFVRVLLGRQGETTAAAAAKAVGSTTGTANKQRHLQTDQDSNLLIYLTGHGGDQFFKFQDIEEITSEEIARAIKELHRRQRYRQILLVADTCQAFTLGDDFTARSTPNVFVVASSLKDESSYAHHSDSLLGLSVIERYTHAFMQFIQKQGGVNTGISVMKAMVEPYTYQQQRAHIGFRDDLGERSLDEIPLSHFFSNNQRNGSERLPTKDYVLFNTTRTASATIPMSPVRYATSKYSSNRREAAAAQRLDLSWPGSPRNKETKDHIVVSKNDSAVPHLDPSSMEYRALLLALLIFVVVTCRIC